MKKDYEERQNLHRICISTILKRMPNAFNRQELESNELLVVNQVLQNKSLFDDVVPLTKCNNSHQVKTQLVCAQRRLMSVNMFEEEKVQLQIDVLSKIESTHDFTSDDRTLLFNGINNRRQKEGQMPLSRNNFCYNVSKILDKDEAIKAAAIKVGLQLIHNYNVPKANANASAEIRNFGDQSLQQFLDEHESNQQQDDDVIAKFQGELISTVTNSCSCGEIYVCGANYCSMCGVKYQ